MLFNNEGMIHLLFLTADSESAARQHFPLSVTHCVVALVGLRHSVSHPHLPVSQQPAPTRNAGIRVGPVPQDYWHRLGWSASGSKLQYEAVFGNVVLKVLAVVSVVGLDAFYGRINV